MNGNPFQSVYTPAYAIDRAIFRRNCERMTEKATKMGLKLRVHVKTHKTIEGARIQVEQMEEKAIIVSTVAELCFYADNGFSNITLGIPFGTHQLPVLEKYSKKLSSLVLLIDNMEHINMLEKTDGHYSIFIKIDTGYHRAGIEADRIDDIMNLVNSINRSKNCTFLGIYSHAGHSYDQPSIEDVIRVAREERDCMVRVRKALEASGIPVEVVSCGSTPACSLNDNWEGITEIHAGNYCCYDKFQSHIGSCNDADNAGFLLCRVLSVYPSRNTILTDGGGIPSSKDKSDLENWGTIKGHDELYVSKLSQEHAIITSDSPIDYTKYPIGTVLKILTNHSCMTAAQHKEYVIVEGDRVVDKWIPAKFW